MHAERAKSTVVWDASPWQVQAAGSFGILAHNCKTAWHYYPQGYDLHGITIHKAMICMLTDQIGNAEDFCWKVSISNLCKGSDSSELFHGFPLFLLADVRLYLH